MSLQLDERVSQRPSRESRPPAAFTDADTAAFLSSAYGLSPDPWQMHVLEAWLGRQADGRWSSMRCGLAIPRQNGKNGIIEIRVLYGMVALGEKWLHTAHEVKTARKAFLRLKSFFENARQWPELAALVDDIRNTNGQEAVFLTNGGSCEFIARSKSSGRGFTVDGVICDEAQELGDDAQEALLPATSSAPQRNPQWIFTGTPPGPRVDGTVFTKLRRDGINGGKSRFTWQEWGLSSLAEAQNMAAIYRVNPGLVTGRLQLEVVEGERDQFSEEGFARERGGYWSNKSATAVLTDLEWLALHDPETRRGSEDLVFAADAELDRSAAAISVATQSVIDVRVHVELTDPGREVPFTVPEAGERLIDLARRRRPRAVVIHSGSPAASLIPVLKANDVPLLVIGPQQARAACGAFMDAATKAKSIVHTGMQTELNDSVVLGRKHQTASGWTWAEDPGTAPLRSVTWAHYGWTAQPPPPSMPIRRVR